MKKTKQSLGRGLSALLGDYNTSVHAQSQGEVHQIETIQIKAGKYQPRQRFDESQLENLMHSIRERGIIQPLVVRPASQDSEGAPYEIIAGERRWRAAKLLGLSHVPVTIRICSDQEALETAIVENIQRDDLTAVEEAEAYQRLMDEFHYTQEQLARSVGKSRSHIANTLRLNGLPSHVKELINQGKISAGHARALIGEDDVEQLADQIIQDKLNVRQVEQLKKSRKMLPTPENEVFIQTRLLEEQISKMLGLEIKIQIHRNGGSLMIKFNSFEDIDDIVELLRSGQKINIS